MPLSRLLSCIIVFGFICISPLNGQEGRALIRHAPNLNATIDGSVQLALPESINLNGGATISADLLVPGTPSIRQNGNPKIGAIIDGSGSALPTNHQLTLNGNVTVGRIVRRTNGIALPAVAAPTAPAGTRSVTINKAGQGVGAWSTLRNLTLNGNVGQCSVPAGAYGDFIANGGSGFTLGTAGATQPSVYHFQRLVLNGKAELRVLGPVIVTGTQKLGTG